MNHPGVVQSPAYSAADAPARIGPNALIQTVRALVEHSGQAEAEALLRRAGQGELIGETPETMVDEARFAALVEALAAALGVEAARSILHRSGDLTAAYLLVHRIPAPFQRLLRLPIPRRMALRLLLLAISQHAWTFVGSGTFTYQVGQTATLHVTSRIEPAGAVCGFYGGTFEHLIHALIDPRARVHTAVDAETGAARCITTVHFAQKDGA